MILLQWKNLNLTTTYEMILKLTQQSTWVKKIMWYSMSVLCFDWLYKKGLDKVEIQT